MESIKPRFIEVILDRWLIFIRVWKITFAINYYPQGVYSERKGK